MKDAGETGAGTATTEREGGDSSGCDRLIRPVEHKALLCLTQSGRRMDWRVWQETAGTQAPGVLRQRVPVLGRE